MVFQDHRFGCVRKTPFRKSGHICQMQSMQLQYRPVFPAAIKLKRLLCKLVIVIINLFCVVFVTDVLYQLYTYVASMLLKVQCPIKALHVYGYVITHSDG